MDATLYLIIATLVFLAIHIVPSTPLRALAVKAVGGRAYLGLFSLASLAGLLWMAREYGRAPVEALWPGLRLLPVALTPFAFVLLACGLLSRNPALLGQAGALKRDDPARGIIRITRHPIMWGIMLWAAAHVLARGELAATVFFGGFLVLAALGTILMDRRKRSNADFQRFKAVTSYIPFVAIAQGRNRIVWREIGWKRPAIGIAVFVLVFFLHPWISGGARP